MRASQVRGKEKMEIFFSVQATHKLKTRKNIYRKAKTRKREVDYVVWPLNRVCIETRS